MNKTMRRLILAASLSLMGFALTFGLDKIFSTKDTGPQNAKQIARLVNTVNDVQLKQIQKLIWEPTVENEVLHVGEAVRTASNSEARIEFLDSKTAIDLEPDSAIVLEEADGKLALDFVKGNIFVKSDTPAGAAGQAITLKSGDRKIDLGKSEVSLGKSQNGGLDMQVLEGSVKGADASTNMIKVLQPLPNEPVYLNTAAGEPASFRWQPLIQGYKLFLEAGPSRQEIKPVAGSEVDGTKGELAAHIKLGKTYFRLVARSNDPKQPELTSPVMRALILAKTPPVLLSPEKETTVTLNKSEPDLHLLWSNPAGFAKVIIEIATSANLAENHSIEYLEDTTDYTFSVKHPGVYYWRVSGVLEGRKEVVSSLVQKFKVSLLDELPPPELDKPKDLDKLPVDLVKEKGLTLTWKPVTGAAGYRVTVENADSSARGPASSEKVFEDEGNFLSTNVPNLKPGEYTWTVASLDNKSALSKSAPVRTFTVQTLPVLNWADGKIKDEHMYISLKPTLPLEWQRGPGGVTKWTLHITSDLDGVTPLTLSTTEPSIETILPKDGVYFAEVEALDAHGNIVARSPKREVSVVPAPLLPAPIFAKSLPDTITATGSGSATVEWEQVQGASKYVVLVKTADGKNAKQYDFDSLSGHVRGLMPGEYKVAMKSVDKQGRSGPEGEERALRVPAQSDVKAPRLKGITVK